MKYTVLPLALMISMFSAAEDGWVAVGQAPAAKPAVKPVPVSQQSNSPSPAKPSLQVELLTMVEMMQQEIAELRGTVEEQNHKIELLQKQQQQRYLDLDRRMAELLNTPVAAVKPNGDLQSNVLPADDLYARAMSFIKKKDFIRALEQLDLFAKTYPTHTLAANTFYWSGEVQLAEGNFALAIKQFETVVYQHPDHNKAADSHYKLAVSYDRSGNDVKAKELLKQVIKQYPGVSDSAVRLAERYLARLQTTSS
ncbi:MAG: tol-pal system protein YbgF [Oleispira sp.]|jgi:tol-pal system protein YbgF